MVTTTAIKDRPILFSTPMVQGIVEDRKTKTRRVVKGQALEWLQPDMFTPEYVASPENKLCPYGYPGDRLWVREAWQYSDNLEEPYLYRQKELDELKPEFFERMKWKPSIHMPREACRLILEITSVKIERLQDISENDAIAEGIELLDGKLDDSPVFRNYNYKAPEVKYGYGFPTNSFRSLWESINGKESWSENPWVWVVEFKKVYQST
ncbi:ASCH domain-containing protein [Pontibacter burrus]|uniref:Morphogenetic protein n=1 Tax=Pontibacter burrus TaxID=2704466 RepID=A0A6B3LGH9_9BACT|nr:hypothetical protein [Pontibacter burrus]NEM96182.1 hypothetical protein [Pontibacter burrus]